MKPDGLLTPFLMGDGSAQAQPDAEQGLHMVMLHQKQRLSRWKRKAETDHGITSTLRNVFGVAHEASRDIAWQAAETGEAVVSMGLPWEQANRLTLWGNATLQDKAREFPSIGKFDIRFISVPQNG